jgi:signal transduction histidine kinase
MGEGLIGTAAATGQTVLRSVLENDPDWHPNPLLPQTKGEIAVPIKLGETILGVLDVQSNASGALDEEDQLLLEGLCGQVAVAIESTRLREEMTERLEEINRLYHAMSHEGWQTYRQTADLPTSFVYDQAGLRPVQDIGLAEELFARAPLAVPGGEVIGTLAIANDPQRPITPEDEDFLQQVSQQVALALEGARLFEQTQEALGQVRRRASELETVAAVSTTASGALDPEVLLQSVVNLTKERFGLYHAHIYLFDPERNELVLTAGAGEVGRKMLAEGWSIPVSHELSIVANAYRKQQSVVANDLHHDKQSGFLSNRLLPNTRSEMALPLVVGDQVLGVFDVQSEEANNFTSEDVNIYTTLASQVAVALQNARLYVEQARTVAQLRELDKLKSSFLANMSHELRTPLNSILGFADVILEELDGPLTENMNNDLRLIQKNGQHLLHLINDVLDMAKIEAGRMNLSPERFTAFEMLEEVTSITSTLASEKNLSLFIDEGSDQDVQIYADRTRMRQVMINLVNNAIKFTETGKISLKLASLAGARILITVKDTGIGIPPDKLEPIFQEFTQVDASSTRKAGGTGLGLPISRRLVEMHGGRLWAESTGIPGEGSTFCVELPVEARITETVEKQVK